MMYEKVVKEQVKLFMVPKSLWLKLWTNANPKLQVYK